MQLSDIISYSSFEIVQLISIPMPLYIFLILIEFAYMIFVAADYIVLGDSIHETYILNAIGPTPQQIIAVITACLFLSISLVIAIYGRQLKIASTFGEDS
jgi:TRAP-type C4-dicarboxylate transport system permease small subunit